MKQYILSLLFTLLFLPASFAQTIEMGKKFYQQSDYERAIFIFERLDSDEATLFLGKSYFAKRKYLKAINTFSILKNATNQQWIAEAYHTTALAHFQLKNYANSLESLQPLVYLKPFSAYRALAKQTYYDIIAFLTPHQTFAVFKSVSKNEIRLDILEYWIGKLDYSTAMAYVSLFEDATLNQQSLRLNRIKTLLADSITYTNNVSGTPTLSAPKGIAYNIGVLLPVFDFETAEYEIPQHIYFGIQLAVEQFNSKNTDQKAFITYRTSNNQNQTIENIISDLVKQSDVDVIIGPLFSNTAKDFSNYTENYKIPMVLPLANADELNLYNNYVFQLNPTFTSQGKLMARKALNLGYDTLGVIVEKKSLGAPAARAFRHEAEQLGGYVEYYFEENFEELGYDIREYTKFFTTVKAIYAPFTGTIAQTLIESLITDLKAMKSKVAILGSQEWQDINIETHRLGSIQIHYSKSFDVDTSTTSAKAFISEFRMRYQTEPNEFAFIGFDAASIILDQLKLAKNPAYLCHYLRAIKGYNGLSIDVSFNGTHVNEAVSIEKLNTKDDVVVD